MRESGFIDWLEKNNYDKNTISSRVANCRRVENFEGDLDYHYKLDLMSGLIDRLTYASKDLRSNVPHRHSIPINGDVYNGTATLKSAVRLYLRYLSDKEFNFVGVESYEVKEVILEGEKEFRDSYARFIKRFNIKKEEIYEFGLEETILPDIELLDVNWKELKRRLFSNEKVYIRGAGRDAKGTQIYLEFYKRVFENYNIEKDPTNNLQPQKIIRELSGYQRNKNLFNYQVSHIFGKTKNPILFEAPWNIALVPKIIDPFTGHETKGQWPVEYQEVFMAMVKERYDKYIREYNEIIRSLDIESHLEVFKDEIKEIYNEKQLLQFSRGIEAELSMID